MNAAVRAKEIRIEFGLRGRVDAEKVADLLGLRVDTRSFRSPEVQEITVGNRIGVSNRLTNNQRRWAIAHGIGHPLLHDASPSHVWLYVAGMTQDELDERDVHEFEAEVFAFNLLVDDTLSGLAESWDLAAYYGVPNSKMALR